MIDPPPKDRIEAAGRVSYLAGLIEKSERSLAEVGKKVTKFSAIGRGDYGDKESVYAEVVHDEIEFRLMKSLCLTVVERKLNELRERHADATTFYNEMTSAGSHEAGGVND